MYYINEKNYMISTAPHILANYLEKHKVTVNNKAVIIKAYYVPLIVFEACYSNWVKKIILCNSNSIIV